MDTLEEQPRRTFKQRGEQDREATERAFIEIVERERLERLEKTMRLRQMRLRGELG